MLKFFTLNFPAENCFSSPGEILDRISWITSVEVKDGEVLVTVDYLGFCRAQKTGLAVSGIEETIRAANRIVVMRIDRDMLKLQK